MGPCFVLLGRAAAAALSQQLETALTELGLDSEDAYHMSRGEQLQLINKTTDSILTDRSLGELARLVDSALKKQPSTSSETDVTMDMDNDQSTYNTADLPETFSVAQRQFGHKVRRHAKDYGLDPSSEADRMDLYNIIIDIVKNSTEKRYGDWRGQDGLVIFYIKDNDVVVTKQTGEFITILKGGIANERVKNARK